MSHQADSMKILFVVKNLPPDHDPEGFCTAKLINALADAGVEITIVTATENPNCQSNHVEFVPDIPARRLDRLRRLQLRFPESGLAWARQAAKVLDRLFTKSNFDFVVTRAMPFVCHLPVIFSRRQNAAWVAHFSDPWPQVFWPDRFGWRKKWHRRVADAADILTYPCQRVLEFCLEEQCGITDTGAFKTLILPHIGDRYPGKRPAAPGGIIRLLHCGRLFDARRPHNLLQAVSELLAEKPALRDRLQIQHAGPTSFPVSDLSKEFGLEGNLLDLGLLTYEDSLRQMMDAEGLLLIENENEKTSIFLPSKLADYALADVPILALSPRDGTVADMLGTDYQFRTDPWDVPAIRQILENFIAAVDSGESDRYAETERLSREFSPSQIAESFIDYLREASK